MSTITTITPHEDMEAAPSVSRYTVAVNGVIYGSSITLGQVARLSPVGIPQTFDTSVNNKFNIVPIIHDPPSMFFATSVYPLHQVDSLQPTINVLGGTLLDIVQEYSDSITLGITDIQGSFPDEFRYLSLDPGMYVDNLAVTLTDIQGSFPEEYRYLSTLPVPDSMTVTLTDIQGSFPEEYRYLSVTIEPEALSLTVTVNNGDLTNA